MKQKGKKTTMKNNLNHNFKTVWIISRYWNKFIFGIMYLCVKLVWDQTKLNPEFYQEANMFFNYYPKILTNRKKEYKFKNGEIK